MAPESRESGPPSIVGVLETVLYYTDHGRAQHFYRDVLGMVLMESDSARHMFFRAGRSVFLLFDAAASLGDAPPALSHRDLHDKQIMLTDRGVAGNNEIRAGIRSDEGIQDGEDRHQSAVLVEKLSDLHVVQSIRVRTRRTRHR